MILPPNQYKNVFNNCKWGIYGELGEGSGVKIRFVQTAIKPNEFEQIKLVPDIEGSERWAVRDLFQREIDEARTDEIKKYLENKDDVKFFNPLTLVVLPMNENKTQVIKETTILSEDEEDIDGRKYKSYIRDKFFKINIDSENTYGRIAWNSERCDIVAIDGQHRLFALKRMHQQGKLDSYKWKIPVVLLIIEKISDGDTETITILEAVRRTFININEKSERINECRKILLDDSSIACMCVQELVELSHRNDNLDFHERESDILPLFFFDWRGVVKKGKQIKNDASVKSIIEIRDWFSHYLIGFDDKPVDQKDNLSLNDMKYGAPQSLQVNQILTPSDANDIREFVRQDFVKGFNYFLINFKPYKEYIKDSLEFEKKLLKEDEVTADIAKQAFLKFKFGRCNPLQNQRDLVEEKYKSIKTYFESKKNTIKAYLEYDIGMRGIMYAFGEFKRLLNKYNSETMTWVKYAEFITEHFNDLYDEGWLNEHSELKEENEEEAKIKELLTYILYNKLGSVQQYYKLENMKQYLGGFFVLLLTSKLKDHSCKILDVNAVGDIVDEFGNYIENSYKKGFSDLYRSENANDYGRAELNEKAKKFAEEKAGEKLGKLLKILSLNDY